LVVPRVTVPTTPRLTRPSVLSRIWWDGRVADDLIPEPDAHGLLDVGDGNQVYWETVGNPDGKPAVVVHGGPGGGCSPRHRQAFDLDRYRVVLFDQRGCGRSTPSAGDPDTDLGVNTTQHLVADMEQLRMELGIDRWLLYGGSWGSTLALAYAQRHPGRVSQIVIQAVTNASFREYDWLYRGAGRFFPEALDAFVAASGLTRLDDTLVAGGLPAAYGRLLADPDPQVRAGAAKAWLTWEDTLVGLEPNAPDSPYGNHPRPEEFVRLCAHYAANLAFLRDEELLADADRLSGIPGLLVHGRLDLSGPADTAWALAKAWPDAELVIVEDAGHIGGADDRRRRAIDAALDRFATLDGK
jgi:proline iminopeptidase